MKLQYTGIKLCKKAPHIRVEVKDTKGFFKLIKTKKICNDAIAKTIKRPTTV